MQQQQLDQVTNWVSKCDTFDVWIDSESNQLEKRLSFPEEEATLDKVLEEEQAIRVSQMIYIIGNEACSEASIQSHFMSLASYAYQFHYIVMFYLFYIH